MDTAVVMLLLTRILSTEPINTVEPSMVPTHTELLPMVDTLVVMEELLVIMVHLWEEVRKILYYFQLETRFLSMLVNK